MSIPPDSPPDSPEPLLEVRGLSVALREPMGAGAEQRRVVDDVSFTLARGERLGLVGASGSGKSVTLLALAGLLQTAGGKGRIVAGELLFRPRPGEPAVDLARLSPAERARVRGRHIALIFQEPATALNPLMTCGMQVAEGLMRHAGLSRTQALERAEALFAEVKLSEPGRVRRSYPHQLSGGQRQRVMIAMALALTPALLLADEPTTALDATTQQSVIETLAELCQARGTGLIFVSHDRGVVVRLCDRQIFLQGGKMIAAVQAPPRGVSAVSPSASAPPLLSVAGLTVSLPDASGYPRRIVSDVSLGIAPAGALALVGESGSGKSTLARAILRLIPLEAGQITLAGLDWLSLPTEQLRRERRRVQLVQQDPFAALNPRLTVRQMLAEPLRVHGLVSTQAAAERRITELLDAVQLPASARERYPHEFSGGQRQRLCIARALALEPQLLICDEALSALDPDLRHDIAQLLAQLQHRLGLALLFITHDLGLAAELCPEALVLQQGRAVEWGPTPRLLQRPEQPYTQTLVAAAAWADPQLAAFAGGGPTAH